MRKIIIAAMTEDRVIGKGNKIPWYIPEDLKSFKRLTLGNSVIMGRNTYQSILDRLGTPLPRRNNLVVSTSLPREGPVTICRTLEEALREAEAYGKDAFFIGGARLYAEALPLAEEMYLSHIKGSYEGDTYFPTFDTRQWTEKEREQYDQFDLVRYVRK